jgi:hypothetical protein
LCLAGGTTTGRNEGKEKVHILDGNCFHSDLFKEARKEENEERLKTECHWTKIFFTFHKFTYESSYKLHECMNNALL